MKVLAFSTAREIAGFAEVEIHVDPWDTPRTIVARVAPALAVGNLHAAVDYEHWECDRPVGEATELVIFPPVSGG